MENISKELNYSPVVNNHSSVVYRTVSSQSGGNVTLGSGAVGPTEFLIPPSCWIPDQTRLNFDLSILGEVSRNTVINANSLTFIDRITVYDTATSNIVMDCSNFHKYASLVVPASTKLDDYLTKPALFVTNTLPTAVGATSNATPFEDIQKNLGTANLNALNTSMLLYNNLGRKQFLFSTSSATAANNNVYLSFSIPFSAFKMTALSSDKIWYSPSSLVIQIYWSATSNFAFTCTGADPTAGTPVALTSASTPTIVTPKLILANEGNLAIVSQVINKVMSGGGIQLPIAYPTVIQTTTTAVGSQSFQYQLTRGYGNRILAIITAAFSTVGIQENNFHTRYVTDYYQTSLNNVAILSPSGLIGASANAGSASTDYSVGNEKYLSGSVIQNVYEYANGEWVHIDGFFGNKRLADVDQHQVDGLDVTAQSSTWQLQATVTSAAYRWFSVVVGQKTMSLTAQGVMVQ